VKPILCLLLAFAAGLSADETADRRAIGQVIAALNEPPDAPGAKPVSSLFTADADSSDRDRLADLLNFVRRYSNQPWPEVTEPRFGTPSIRFISPYVALVDTAVAQFGSTIGVRRFPAFLVMRRDGVEWRIVAVRTAPDPLRLSIFPVLN